jgi:hypothetical protein
LLATASSNAEPCTECSKVPQPAGPVPMPYPIIGTKQEKTVTSPSSSPSTGRKNKPKEPNRPQ